MGAGAHMLLAPGRRTLIGAPSGPVPVAHRLTRRVNTTCDAAIAANPGERLGRLGRDWREVSPSWDEVARGYDRRGRPESWKASVSLARMAREIYTSAWRHPAPCRRRLR